MPERPIGPVERVSGRLDHYKYVVIPTEAIGCVSPEFLKGDIKNGIRQDVVGLTIKIEAIKGADKGLIVEEQCDIIKKRTLKI